MRTQTFISSMVGVVAVAALAGSANAAVSGVSLWDFRDFSIGTAPVGNTQGGNTGVAPGNLFPDWETLLYKAGTSMTGSGGKVNVVLSAINYSNAYLLLSDVSASNPVNLTGTTSFDINVTSTNGVASQWGVQVIDNNLNSAYMTSTVVTGNTVGSVSFLTSGGNWTTEAGFDWSQVIEVDLNWTKYGTGAAATSFSFDSFTAVGAVVPAPGAAALVGLAGLVATRRRRN